MSSFARAAATIVIALTFLPAGCPGPASMEDTTHATAVGPTAGDTATADPAGTSTDATNGAGDATDQTAGTGDQGDGTATTETGKLQLTGRLAPGHTAKVRPRAEDTQYPYTVVAQSDQSGKLLRIQTESDGGFTIDIPDEEAGHSFTVTVLGPDGRAVGPITFGPTSGGIVTGLALERAADLGTIDLPADPATTPIQPGADGNANELADPNVSARTNSAGVPVGLESHGKGADSKTTEASDLRQADKDRDGLIDMLDADDDGDGILDDFDGHAGMVGTSSDTRANFFMNLKVSAENAQPYYGGTTADLATDLAEDTVITFEVLTEPTATRHIVSAHLLETPGPAYLPGATALDTGTGGSTLWSASGYAFTARSDRFDAFAVPHAEMQAGDTFTAEVAFDDGTTEQYARMLNFIFRNIPRLMYYGPAGGLATFSVTDPNINGTPSRPIPFDGAQNLVLEFIPPLDEAGLPLTGMDYSFQFFYSSATQAQLNSQINPSATWPTPISGFSNNTYYVHAADLGTLSADNTYTVTLAKEMLPTTLVLTDGTSATVTQYTIDITAECPSGNAALKAVFVKQ